MSDRFEGTARGAFTKYARACCALLRSNALAFAAMLGVIVVFWAEPAHAVAGLVLVESSSATNSNSEKSATASCTGGKKLFGGAYNIVIDSGASGEVYVQSMVPNSTLSQVTVTAHEDVDGFSGTWHLVAQAICGTDVGNMTLQQASTPSNVSVVKDVTATCPASRKAYGAGFSISSDSIGVGAIFPSSLAYDTALTQAGASAVLDNSTSSPTWSLRAFVICGNATAGMNLVTAGSAFDSTTPKSKSLSCPLGQKLTGVSWSYANTDHVLEGNIIMEDVFTTAAVASITGKGVENDPISSSWRFFLGLICSP